MDKYEFNIKTEQIKKLIRKKEYQAAAKIADTMDFTKVKNNALLITVADVYEVIGEYDSARDILEIAYERTQLGRQIAFRLTRISVKRKDLEEAMDYYEDFVAVAPKDASRYILQYEISKLKGEPIENQIAILEKYVEDDMDDKWTFELAKLNHKAGNSDKCVELCDTIILWFSEGKYVDKAMELKMLHAPLSKSQQEKYDKRWEEKEQDMNVDEIKLKEVSVDNKYDTYNIQAEIAKSMVELFGETEDKKSIEKTKVIPSREVIKEIANAEGTKAVDADSFGKVQLYNQEADNAAEGEVTDELPGEVVEEAVKDEQIEGQITLDELLNGMYKPADEEVMDEKISDEEISDEEISDEEISDEEIPGDEIPGEGVSEENVDDNGYIEVSEELKELSEVEELQEITEDESIEIQEEQEAIDLDIDAEENIEAEESETSVESENKGENEVENLKEENDMVNAPIEDMMDVLNEVFEELEERTSQTAGKDTEVVEAAETIANFKETAEEAIEEIAEEATEEAVEETAEETAEEATEEATEKPSENEQESMLKTDTKKLIKEFIEKYAGLDGLDKQVIKVLQNMLRNNNKHNDYLYVMGDVKSGKTTLAMEIIKLIGKVRLKETKKIAKVNGTSFTEKNISTFAGKLGDCDVVIEKASTIEPGLFVELMEILDAETVNRVVVFEDERTISEKYMAENHEIVEKFENIIKLKNNKVKDWAKIAVDYANEQGYEIDEMGMLALHARIDQLYTITLVIHKNHVEQLIDLAIRNAERKSIGKLVKGLFGKKTSVKVLTEADFIDD